MISDNGTSFKKKHVKKILKRYHIQHRFSIPYYPQSNGQDESSNKILRQILCKTINKHGKDWHTQLTYSLWAYRISVHIATCTTPYNLVYGFDAIMPLKLEIPSLRISLKGIVDDDFYQEQRLQQLEMLDEQCINSLEHIQAYHKYLQRSYNDKFIQCFFSVGGLTLYIYHQKF